MSRPRAEPATAPLRIAADSRALRWLRRALGGAARRAPDWQAQELIVARALVLVRVFYGIGLAKIYGHWEMISGLAAGWEARDPLWPSRWLDHVPREGAGDLLLVALFAVGAGVLAFPMSRVLRVLSALGALQVAALANSWGGINHGYHEWVWISVVLCFLPNGARPEAPQAARAWRQQVILAVASVALVLLLFYTMSGAYKLWFAAIQLMQGEFGGLSPTAMAVTVARRSLETMNDPPLAPLVIAWPLLGWPLYLFVYYAELVAVAIAFRPRLLVAWGMALVVFHLGTAAFMGIAFTDHVIWNVMFLMAAPHAVSGDWRRALGDLPLFGWAARRWLRARGSRSAPGREA